MFTNIRPRLPRRLKHSAIDLDLFHARAVESSQGGSDSCFLAGSRGSVEEKMWEVTTSSKGPQPLGQFGMIAESVESTRAVLVYK
jgi:hypothetical protein